MKQSTPNLPASSRMQMPAGGGMKSPKMPMTKNSTLKKGKKGSSMPKKPSMK
jgi:hypothetical protein